MDTQDKRTIIWYLASVALASGSYESGEKQLIKHLANKFGTESSILAEIEDCARALYELQAKQEFAENSGDYKLEAEIQEDRQALLKNLEFLINLK